MTFHSETAIFKACRTLFGKEVALSPEFLNYLQPSGARTAFRNQAKAHHPDIYARASAQIRKQQTERFKEIRQAYDLILNFLKDRQHERKTVSEVRQSPASSYWSRSSSRSGKDQKPHYRPSRIPAIPLEFGMFSYYQGKVTYQQLIEALVWQRRQRPTLGAIAQRWGWISEDKVLRVLGHRGRALRFGNRAIELGYLNPHQVDELLNYQRSLQKRIGDYFIEKGLLSPEEADQVSKKLKIHNSQVARHTWHRASSST